MLYIIRLNYHISNRFDEILFIWNTIHVFLRHQYLAELSNYVVYVSFALFNELKRQKQTGILIYPYATKNEHQKLVFCYYDNILIGKNKYKDDYTIPISYL